MADSVFHTDSEAFIVNTSLNHTRLEHIRFRIQGSIRRKRKALQECHFGGEISLAYTQDAE
jgi:hypothetical protein